MSTGAHVLEIGRSTIGIVVPEGGHRVRFYASRRVYHRLDGQLFRSSRHVLAAARSLQAPGGRARAAHTI